MNYAIEVNGLTKHYKDFTLDHVSFRVPAGTIVGCIGENGAGKSTTIKAILDLIRRDEGTVRVLGQEDGARSPKIKEQIGVVFEGSYFPDQFRTVDVEAVMRRLYRNWETETFWSYCREFRIPEKKKVKEFSGGMKVKLSLAVALSHRAKLLILDDACGALDPVVRSEILDIFLDFIQEEDHTVFLSSHITSDIEKISDYILLIHQGKLLFFENKDTLIYDYGIVRCSEEQFAQLDPEKVIGAQRERFCVEALVSNRRELEGKPHEYAIDRASIEEILLHVVKSQERSA